jgi:hypothetical protein
MMPKHSPVQKFGWLYAAAETAKVLTMFQKFMRA